jgi:hypothetical protein
VRTSSLNVLGKLRSTRPCCFQFKLFILSQWMLYGGGGSDSETPVIGWMALPPTSLSRDDGVNTDVFTRLCRVFADLHYLIGHLSMMSQPTEDCRNISPSVTSATSRKMLQFHPLPLSREVLTKLIVTNVGQKEKIKEKKVCKSSVRNMYRSCQQWDGQRSRCSGCVNAKLECCYVIIAPL